MTKRIACRLSEDQDTDIIEDLEKNENGKTARIKEVYRMGLAYENMQANAEVVASEDTFNEEAVVEEEAYEDTVNEAIEAKRRKAYQLAIPRKPSEQPPKPFLSVKIGSRTYI